MNHEFGGAWTCIKNFWHDHRRISTVGCVAEFTCGNRDSEFTKTGAGKASLAAQNVNTRSCRALRSKAWVSYNPYGQRHLYSHQRVYNSMRRVRKYTHAHAKVIIRAVQVSDSIGNDRRLLLREHGDRYWPGCTQLLFTWQQQETCNAQSNRDGGKYQRDDESNHLSSRLYVARSRQRPVRSCRRAHRTGRRLPAVTLRSRERVDIVALQSRGASSAISFNALAASWPTASTR